MDRIGSRGLLCITFLFLFFATELEAGQLAHRFCGVRDVEVIGRSPRPLVPFSAPNLPPADSQSAPVVVDVMFLYTPQTVIGAGSEAKIHRQIHESIEETNYRLTNSRVNVRINPVFIGRIAYAESGDIQVDLQRLVNYDGAFARAGTLRQDYKADIVCLVTELENLGIGGYAWDIPDVRGNAATAFTAVRRQVLGKGKMVLAHELGHLFGCSHDREHAGNLEDPWFRQRRPYFFGYRVEVQGVTYVDVMGYEPGISLPNFSNPRIELDGVPLGIPEGSPGASDIARTINETAPYVAAYRTAISRVEFTEPRFDVDESNRAIVLTLRRSGDLNSSVRVTLTIATDSTARATLDYLRPEVMNYTFQTNQSEATFEIPLVKDDVPEPTETLRITLGAPFPNTHGIGWQGETIVYINDLPPVVSLPDGPIIAQEKDGVLEIQAPPQIRGAGSGRPPEPSWRLEAGTALAGKDFVAATGQLTYSGQALVDRTSYAANPIRIELLNDSEAEPDKKFQIVFEGLTREGADSIEVYGPVTREILLVDDDRSGAFLRSVAADVRPASPVHLAVRHDRKLLVWGAFDQIAGTDRSCLALLNEDGTVDRSFNPPTFLVGHRLIERLPKANVQFVKPLPDGKFLAAGFFSKVNGNLRTTIVRLNADGSLDTSFGANLKFDGAVNDVAIQPDGKYVVAGSFENINDRRHAFVARLHPDGSIDESFKPKSTGATSGWTVILLAVTLQPDGKILIGGYLERYDGETALNIARLNPDGSLDSTFKLKNASGPVARIVLQNDGKIILGGLFDTVGSRAARKLARILPDGSPDTTFLLPRPNADVREILSLPDRRMLISGAFTTVANTNRRFIALLKENGAIDDSFDLGLGPDEMPGFTTWMSQALSMHADGTLYIGGQFESFSGLPSGAIALVKLGPAQNAITGTSMVRGSEISVLSHLFPGRYMLEATSDFSQWTPHREFVAEGYDREARVSATIEPGARFFRVRNLDR